MEVVVVMAELLAAIEAVVVIVVGVTLRVADWDRVDLTTMGCGGTGPAFGVFLSATSTITLSSSPDFFFFVLETTSLASSKSSPSRILWLS